METTALVVVALFFLGMISVLIQLALSTLDITQIGRRGGCSLIVLASCLAIPCIYGLVHCIRLIAANVG